MTLEERVKQLEVQMECLQAAFVQYQKNQVPITAKTDDTANKVVEITPYTESKDVYIGNTECVFEKIKDGNISAWLTVGNEQIPCTYEVANNVIIVKFEALEAVGTANISIQ